MDPHTDSTLSSHVTKRLKVKFGGEKAGAMADDDDVDACWPGEEADGEEEPLFADDITDDEGDPPPLPPPMPSLGELRQRRHSNAGNTNDGVASGGGVFPDAGSQQGPGGAGAAQGGGTNDQEPPQKKRKPILTLKIERIFSDKGLSYIEKEFPKLKFKGKGHEASDLKYLLQQYEHWANMLYPKLTFKDLTDRVEALASKKEFKSQLLLMRRRAARGGRATPPLDSDDNDGEEGRTGDGEEGRTGKGDAGRGPAHSEVELPKDGPDGEDCSQCSGGESTDGGLVNHVQNSDSVMVDGANGDHSAIADRVSDHSNSALNRLTMDTYGSSDED